MDRRLKILVSAYFCSPYKGSESGLGWNVVCRLATRHDVTVLCGDLSGAQPTRRDLERYRDEHGLPDGLTIRHVAPDFLVRMLNWLHRVPGLWFVYYLAYRRWQKLALVSATELQRKSPFDLVHHLNIIGFREPGYLWKLEVPFFWGPLSGAPVVPAGFLKDFSAGQRLRWTVRNHLNLHQRQGGTRCRRAAGRASRIWTVSREDREMVSEWGWDSQPLLETGGTPPGDGACPVELRPGEPLRLVWSGVFLGIKALPLVLRAVARAQRSRDVVLDVLGDGPEKLRWMAEVKEQGLEKQVCFHGFVPKAEAIAIMRKAHVLFHSSVKEGTPHVVLEALSLGLPVICHDACGMGVAVTRDCGIKVPLESPETSVEGFAAALDRLAADSALLKCLSEGALERSRELSWEAMTRCLEEGYRAAVADPLQASN